MQATTDDGARRRSLWLVLGLAGVAAAATAVAGLSGSPAAIEASPSQVFDDGDGGHDHDGHRHASTLGPDGRFTGPGEVWPPEVRGATDIVTLDFAAEEAPTSRRALEADRAAAVLAASDGEAIDVALADADVAAALGDRHATVSVTDDEVVPGSGKGEPTAMLVLLYSHDRGANVEVYVIGSRVIEVVSRPAGTDQPPLAVDEKHRAAEIARAHWEADGDDRIEQLDGFVILAVQPDGSYHDTRVAYVSFHVDNVARPELLTWVDLTTETVLRAEVDR
ncbi:MAG: hypothetical protein AAGA93_09115 [Actinomycetota bacterium]